MIRMTAVVALVALSGCQLWKNDAEKVMKTSNADFEVERLFTVDGCSTYRFEDGYTHYYTVCQQSPIISTMSAHEESEGDGENESTRTVIEEVPTVIVGGSERKKVKERPQP